ncbi:MAG: GGDEF domain-containing protein [Pseudomonadota bacterium]|uniref:GGDEF domain-containing protein n=1 Tax=Polaromonas sp. TaxID=1869339 RepID=UPI001854AA88|nr:GGDEF domain-containing protein [Polaromonas sp.]MBA3594319.1 GGDEF domain-containing protein [Polaromonas sp.]MDQ3271203.1 GGDEF domain-containing protein [Pseudomonadota bacterium]
MSPVFNPDTFVLGIAVGVLGLVMLLSLIVAYAYDEPTLFALGGYLVGVTLVLLAGRQMRWPVQHIEVVLLILGPAAIAGLHIWLLRKRTTSAADKVLMAATLLIALGLAGLRLVDDSPMAVLASSYGLGTLLLLSWLVLCLPAWRISGPWKWWLLLGHVAGALVAVLFLLGSMDSRANYWPVAMLLLAQGPPTYLALVWRSRLLNEGRLRGLAAKVTDPLTGLSSLAVLIDRLRPAINRAQKVKYGGALYLIAIHNFSGLVNELGVDAKEKLILEAANRIRRAISDSDTAARITEQLFAVVAQDLEDDGQVDSLATRLLVSGLRIESDFLPGVSMQFRVIATNLKVPPLTDVAAAQNWLRGLLGHFGAWPDTHRSRNILLFSNGQIRRPQTTSGNSTF